MFQILSIKVTKVSKVKTKLPIMINIVKIEIKNKNRFMVGNIYFNEAVKKTGVILLKKCLAAKIFASINVTG